MKRKYILVIGLALFLMAGCNNGDSDLPGGSNANSRIETFNLSLLCVGDIMEHSTQLNAQYDKTTGVYDFNNNYTYVKPYIEQADVAFCNVETVFADKEPSGYPLFNAPDSLATALRQTGFDVAFTANNHMLDQGSAGVERTIDVLRANDLMVVGSKKEGEPNFALIESNGVKIGVVAYTYETTGGNINGIAIPSSVADRICSFDPSNWKSEINKILSDIQAAKTAGAEILVCYMHWGEEYHTQPRDYQVGMTNQILAEAGVDVIFASHPHVIQPAMVLFSEEHQKNVAVFYSLGNFISNQRDETLNNRLTEDGMIAQVDFQITKEDGVVKKIDMVKSKALPTWVNRYKDGGSEYIYEIIPLDDNYQSNASLAASGNLTKAQKSITDSANLIGGPYERDEKGFLIIYDLIKWRLENGYDEFGMKVDAAS